MTRVRLSSLLSPVLVGTGAPSATSTVSQWWLIHCITAKPCPEGSPEAECASVMLTLLAVFTQVLPWVGWNQMGVLTSGVPGPQLSYFWTGFLHRQLWYTSPCPSGGPGLSWVCALGRVALPVVHIAGELACGSSVSGPCK